MTEPLSGTDTPEPHDGHTVSIPGGGVWGSYTVLLDVLDDVEASVRMGDMQRLAKVAFVWAQRRAHLLAGEESWNDQRIGGFHGAD